MRVADLKGRTIVVWGMGREGKASAGLLRKMLPGQALTFVDENPDAEGIEGYDCVTGADKITPILNRAEIIIKSPGISLYHPLLQGIRERKIPVTSLLNLWFAEPHSAKTLAVTGTKGKSTVSALLAHTLQFLGKSTALIGNIGVPVTDAPAANQDFAVIEVSSYQASDFSGDADIGVLTSLYPEHLDWHKSLAAYYRDKLNLLAHSRIKIVNHDALALLSQHDISRDGMIAFNDASGMHVRDGAIYHRNDKLGALKNRHLARPHNLINACAVLTVIKQLGLDVKIALQGMESYEGLPHRQQELGTRDGVLYIDDSISTTPQSAIAAMEAYAGKPITLIAGGYDRGIDYTPLVDYVLQNDIHAVICLGPSGQRIFNALKGNRADNIFQVSSLADVVRQARDCTPSGGVVLLSPAAPSYGMFKDYIERGKKFAALAGFSGTREDHAQAV